MAQENTPDTTNGEEEIVDAETTEATDEGATDGEEATGSSTTVDYEAERQAEEGRGKPDPIKAKVSFVERKAERIEKQEDGIKPDELSEIRTGLQSIQKELHEDRALAIARGLSSNDAEVQAVLSKWRNRVFPAGMPLADQIEEMYGAVNRKKIIGQRNEALRALKAKASVSTDTATTQRDGMDSPAPKLGANSPLNGYKHEGNGLYSKKLQSGKTIFVNTKAASNQPKKWVE